MIAFNFHMYDVENRKLILYFNSVYFFINLIDVKYFETSHTRLMYVYTYMICSLGQNIV